MYAPTVTWAGWWLLVSQGYLPKLQLLRKYNLMEFAEVAAAVR